MSIDWQTVGTVAFVVFALLYFWIAPKLVIRLRDRLEPSECEGETDA